MDQAIENQENKNSDEKASGEKVRKKLRATFLDFLAGESQDFNPDLKPYLPHDMIGGSVPHIPGTEDDAVWHAASQACATEKIHYCYTVSDGRVWYLACPSMSLASNPHCWCPLAASLPGNSEYWDKETVYIYEQEGLASALRWDPETGRMQVFLGAARTILPRVQSMDANFVTINPELADIVPWRNRTLRTEKMSRAVIRMLIYSGLVVNMIAALILLVSLIAIGVVQTDLNQVKMQTDDAALKLVEDASNVMQSDTIKHMVRVQQILDNIALSNGYLVKYEVSGKRVEWQGIVPEGLVKRAIEDTTMREISGGRIRSFAPQALHTEEGGMVRIEGKK